MTLDQIISLGWAQSEADARRTSYARALRIALLIDIVLGAYAVIAPTSFSGVLGIAVQPSGWVAAWGGLTLLAAALHIPGLLDPMRRRWSNVVGAAGRFLLAILYLVIGGGFLWLALLQVVLSLILAWLYFTFLKAELMSRP